MVGASSAPQQFIATSYELGLRKRAAMDSAAATQIRQAARQNPDDSTASPSPSYSMPNDTTRPPVLPV